MRAARGIRVLTSAELEQGDVSLAYVEPAHAPRVPRHAAVPEVLQSIWHQVNNGQESTSSARSWTTTR